MKEIVDLKPLTTGDVARYCGVNQLTVLRWIERGELSAFKLPGRGDNRVNVSDFIQFLSKHGMPVPAALQQTNKKILIAEDDVNLASSMKRILSKAGYEISIAHDGFGAGAMLAHIKPRVMLVDLMMPGMSGLEVINAVRQIDQFKDVKLLVVSGLPKQQLEAAVLAGANDYLEKPYQPENLVAKVNKLMGIK